jgi:hypothetical protein
VSCMSGDKSHEPLSVLVHNAVHEILNPGDAWDTVIDYVDNGCDHELSSYVCIVKIKAKNQLAPNLVCLTTHVQFLF